MKIAIDSGEIKKDDKSESELVSETICTLDPSIIDDLTSINENHNFIKTQIEINNLDTKEKTNDEIIKEVKNLIANKKINDEMNEDTKGEIHR